MTKVHLTKKQNGTKQCYYVQFVEETLIPKPDYIVLSDPENQVTNQAWLTVFLGYVPAGSQQFVIPRELYLDVGSKPVFGESVTKPELDRYMPEFAVALTMVTARLEANLRRSMIRMNHWLNQTIGSAPNFSEKEFLALQRLRELKDKLFRGDDTASQEPCSSTCVNKRTHENSLPVQETQSDPSESHEAYDQVITIFMLID